MHSTQNSEKWELEIYYNLVLNLLVGQIFEWELRTWNLGQIFEVELWLVGQ